MLITFAIFSLLYVPPIAVSSKGGSHVSPLRVSLGPSFPGGTSDNELDCQCKRPKRQVFDLWARKIPWRRAWQPTPVVLPGESSHRGAWQAADHGVKKSWTRLKLLSTQAL